MREGGYDKVGKLVAFDQPTVRIKAVQLLGQIYSKIDLNTYKKEWLMPSRHILGLRRVSTGATADANIVTTFTALC